MLMTGRETPDPDAAIPPLDEEARRTLVRKLLTDCDLAKLRNGREGRLAALSHGPRVASSESELPSETGRDTRGGGTVTAASGGKYRMRSGGPHRR